MWSKVPVPTPRDSRVPGQHHDLQVSYTDSSVIYGEKFQYLFPSIAVSLANTMIYRCVIQTLMSYMEKGSSTCPGQYHDLHVCYMDSSIILYIK